MVKRELCEAVFREAIALCDPALRVREALERAPLRGRVIGLAVGKAAVAMACGAGPVERGLVVIPRRPVITLEWDVKESQALVPAGWTVAVGEHPLPDECSFEAGRRAIELIESAGADELVLALISGGTSSLIEQPLVDDYIERVGSALYRGVPIRELNALRTSLSAIKGGKLAARCKAPIVTLLVSDVIGDDPLVIGSGPTIRDGDRVEVVAPMASFGEAITEALVARDIDARRIAEPIDGDVAHVAAQLAREQGVIVAWGEPTIRLPDDHGEGGRAQQLALELALVLQGTRRSAFVAGSDGIDGSTQLGAAGAYIDGRTWQAIGPDAPAALQRCDAGAVLGRVGALVVTGPTGINHADIAILG